MLKQILIKTTEQKVLAHLLKHSGGFLYNREIAKTLSINETACSQSLKRLYSHQLLIKKEIGRNKLYAINENGSYINLLKSYAAALDIESLIRELKEVSKLIILFGSVAKGLYDITQESDIDLFIVTNQKQKAQKIIDVFINAKDYFFMPRAIIKSEIEYIKMQENDKKFFGEINKGIILWKKQYDEEF